MPAATDPERMAEPVRGPVPVRTRDGLLPVPEPPGSEGAETDGTRAGGAGSELSESARPDSALGWAGRSSEASDQGPVRAHDELHVRGLLHDLGHGLATLSYLADAVREDLSLSETGRERLELMEHELARLLDLTDRGLRAPATDQCDLRDVVGQLVSLTAVATDTSVRLLPCPETVVRTDRSVAHRMLGNVLDNAVRAAGSGGTVEVAIIREQASGVTVEIADDGPGFGRGPGGTASLGLGIVTGLASACGANLYIGPARPRGTQVRVTFPDAL